MQSNWILTRTKTQQIQRKEVKKESALQLWKLNPQKFGQQQFPDQTWIDLDAYTLYYNMHLLN